MKWGSNLADGRSYFAPWYHILDVLTVVVAVYIEWPRMLLWSNSKAGQAESTGITVEVNRAFAIVLKMNGLLLIK